MAFNIQLEFSSGRKRFAIKKKWHHWKEQEKIYRYRSLVFFFEDAAYDYERVKQSAFYPKKAPRSLGGPFLLDDPI